MHVKDSSGPMRIDVEIFAGRTIVGERSASVSVHFGVPQVYIYNKAYN